MDKPPENEFHEMIHQLKTTYDWNKVVKIRLAKTEAATFIKTLHAVDSEKLTGLLEKAGKRPTESSVPAIAEPGVA